MNKTKIRIFLLLLVLCVVLSAPAVFDIFTMPLITMMRRIPSWNKKMSRLIRKAASFDQKTVLQNLNPNSKNSYYYLFAEHLDLAKIEPNSSPSSSPLPAPLNGFTFDNNDESLLVFHKAEHIIAKGLCSIKCSPGSFITNAWDLLLNRENLSEIEIRLKAKQGKKLLLGLSSNPAAQWSERDKIVQRVMVGGFEFKKREICIVPLTIIPDNNFHTYNIHVESKMISNWITFDDVVRKFFISLPEIPDNEIVIDSIRFITKKEKFNRTSFGQSYVNKNKERRNVLYMKTPGRLRYTLTLAHTTPYLSFGTGCLEPNDPVEFKVSIKSNNSEKVIFQKTTNDPDIWTFEKLDLSEYTGKTVDVIFSNSSSQGNIAFWSNPEIYTPPQEKFNVIILLQDALRADHLSSYGYTTRATSPFCEKFAQTGVIFKNAFSQATATRPSCPSFMTSLFPTAAGVGLSASALNERYLTLAEIMRSQGYATAAINQNSNAGYYNGLHQGFSRLYDLEDVNTKTSDVYGKQLKSWLDEKQGRNFFLYLHILDPHGVFNPPAPFDQWYREAHLSGETLLKDPALDPVWMEKPTLEGRRLLYDGEIRNNDHWFERFYEILLSRDLLKNTLIILIADHGENLGERDTWGHKPPGYIQGIHVPLIMISPQKLPPKKVISAPVQLIDIMPTILDIAGIDKDEMVLQGDSLLPLINESNLDFWDSRICFSEEVINRSKKFDNRPFGSLIIDNWHFLNSKEFLPLKLRKRYSGAEPFLSKAFQYTTDREELQFVNSFYFDFVGKFIVSRIMKIFHRRNQQICQGFTGKKEGAIKSDPEVMEKLRALGYVQ